MNSPLGEEKARQSTSVTALSSVLAMAGVACGALWAWPFTVDDAYIVGRYAQRLAHGHGYGMNTGQITDGVTGPFGLWPGLIAEYFGFDAVFAAKLVGLASTMAAVGVTMRAWRHSQRAANFWLAVLLGTNATLWVWAIGGLETGLATLALTLAAFGKEARLSWRLGDAALWVVPWLRPELVPAAAVLAFSNADGSSNHRVRRVAVLIMGLMTVIAFRCVMFGHPLPLSAAAKPALVDEGLAYVLRALFFTFGLVGVPALVWATLRGEHRVRRTSLTVLVHLVAIALAGGDWMPGFRLLAPVVPLALWSVVQASRSWRPQWAMGFLGFLLLAQLCDAWIEIPMARAGGEAREVGGNAMREVLERMPGPVALVDVGYLAYGRDVEVVDLGGVTDPWVGRSAGGHLDKVIDPGWLAQRDPQTIVIHSTTRPQLRQGRMSNVLPYPVEARVFGMAWVREHFRVAHVVSYAPNYHYVVLRRSQRAGAGGGI